MILHGIKLCTCRNLAMTCFTHTFPTHWTKILSGQPQPVKMLTEEYRSSVPPEALLWVLP